VRVLREAVLVAVVGLTACGSSPAAKVQAAAGGGAGLGGQDNYSVGSSSTPEAESGGPDLRGDGGAAGSLDVESAGAAGALDSDAGAHPVSKYCGDAIRDPVTEECDHGSASNSETCSVTCIVQEVGLKPATSNSEPTLGFSLGRAPHVASGAELGFAIVYQQLDDTRSVWLQGFDSVGLRSGTALAFAADNAPFDAANPAIAALPGGGYAVAWTDGSSGTPDVLLRNVDPSAGTFGDAKPVHENQAGFQQDPDLLWVDGKLVVAWTDLLSIKARSFDKDLAPLELEHVLSTTVAVDSSVVLAPFHSGWAAAFRSNTQGLERIRVVSGTDSWATQEGPPGADADRPTLAALDEDHALLVFSVGTDPTDTGAPNVYKLRAALLSANGASELQPFLLADLIEPATTDALANERGASAVKVDDNVYLSWQSTASSIGSHPRVALARVVLDSTSTQGVRIEPVVWPPVSGGQAQPMSSVHLSIASLFPSDAVITAWETTSIPGTTPTSSIEIDFRPSPFVFLN